MHNSENIKELLAVVLRSISEQLGVQNVALLIDHGGTYVLEKALGYDTLPSLRLSENEALINSLKSGGTIISLSDEDSNYLITAGSGLIEAEQDLLDSLRTKLLVPIFSNDKLIGCMLIGEKRSREPFSETDKNLLNTMATLVRLSFENNLLSEERKQSKWLFQELEVAREMYEELLPKSFNRVPDLDCAADCRQVFSIGGDYYDFISLPDGKFAFIICDVAGKGITAALMMANLRVALHREISRDTMNLVGLMDQLNRLIYEASPASRYITLFYAQYDPKTSHLKYVNAGHAPPLLLRRTPTPKPPKLLDVGGTIVGMWEKVPVPYKQGTEILRPGDVIIAYTDGVTDALNPAGEEWGLERLKEEVLNSCDKFDASGLTRHLLDKIDEFVAGAKQFDDTTVVIIKALGGSVNKKSV